MILSHFSGYRKRGSGSGSSRCSGIVVVIAGLNIQYEGRDVFHGCQTATKRVILMYCMGLVVESYRGDDDGCLGQVLHTLGIVNIASDFYHAVIYYIILCDIIIII